MIYAKVYLVDGRGRRRIVTQHSYGDIFGQWGGALELERVERKVIDTLYILR